MPAMTDTMAALTSLQEAVDNKLVTFQKCKLHPELQVHVDQPSPGVSRFTYASIRKGNVLAIAMFVLTEPVKGEHCFQLGYAVCESARNAGMGSAIVAKGIEEISNGFKATPLKRFYVEAVVGKDNPASNKIAAKILSTTPTEIIDAFSGEPALQYLRLVE